MRQEWKRHTPLPAKTLLGKKQWVFFPSPYIWRWCASTVLDRNNVGKNKNKTLTLVRRGEKKAVERGWSSADRFLWQAGARSCKVTMAKLEGLKDKLTFATPLQVWAGTWADTPLWRSGRVRPPEAPTGNQKIRVFWCFLTCSLGAALLTLSV